MKLKRTVDLQRSDSGKKHQKIGDSLEIALREDIQNGYAYNADEFLFFSLYSKRTDEFYIVTCHNGMGFNDGDNIIQGLDYNRTGGLGLQGSGAKTAIYGLNDKIKLCNLIIASKTLNDGEKAYKLFHTTETQIDVEDVSEEVIMELKGCMGELYDKYNVFYLRRYTPRLFTLNKDSRRSVITTHKNMFSLKRMIGEYDIKLSYLEYMLYSDVVINKSDLIHRTPDLDAYKTKSFKVEVDDIEYIERNSGVENKLKYGAEITYDFFLNIRNIDDQKNVIYDKDQHLDYRTKPTRKGISKFTTFVYQDCVLEGDNTRRANNEPIMVSKNFDRTILLESGVEYLNDKFVGDQIKQNKQLSKIILDFWGLENEDNIDWSKYSINPQVLVTVKLKNITNIYDYFGSIDNTFYVNNERKTRDIIKQAIYKAVEDDNSELNECRKYSQKFINVGNVSRLLPIFSGTVSTKNLQLEIQTTKKTIDLAEKFDIPTIPRKIGTKIRVLPYNMDFPIPVKIFNLEDGKYLTSNEIVCNYGGIDIKKIDTQDKYEYTIQVSQLYHIVGDDEKEYHELADHKHSSNYFPKKEGNDFIIDGEYFKTNLKVDIPMKSTINRNPGSGGKDRQTTTYYRYMRDTPDVICKYSKATAILHPNACNKYIKMMSVDRNGGYTNLWNKCYNKFRDAARSVFYGKNNVVDFYKLNGDVNKVAEEYGDEKNLILNIILKTIIENDSDCQKLMNAESHLIKSFNNEHEENINTFLGEKETSDNLKSE